MYIIGRFLFGNIQQLNLTELAWYEIHGVWWVIVI